MRWGIQKAETVDLANRLILNGARLTTVRALTGISERESSKLYREIMGKGPQTGCVPSSVTYFFQTPLTQFHASAFYSMFVLAKNANPDGVLGDLLIDAFDSYKMLALKRPQDDGVLDIDRAFVLAQAVESEEAFFKKCAECHGHYISAHLLSSEVCPICDSIRRETCACCGNKFVNFLLYPKRTVGRHSTLCPACKSIGARPRRKQAGSVFHSILDLDDICVSTEKASDL